MASMNFGPENHQCVALDHGEKGGAKSGVAPELLTRERFGSQVQLVYVELATMAMVLKATVLIYRDGWSFIPLEIVRIAI